MNIAVIGGGLSGLSAAWLLGREHRVTLYERRAQPGFTASSVAVPWRGESVRVDVPLRVFYAGYYPTLTRLYTALGVESEPVSYASGFSASAGRPYFRYRNLAIGGGSYGYVAPHDLRGRPARRIVCDILRFHREAPAALRRGELAGLSIGEYVAARGHAPAFVDGFLLPAIATVCTCTYALARQFPAAVIVDYLARGLSRESVRRATHGADDAARRLIAGIGAVRCAAQVQGVHRDGDGVRVHEADGAQARYDHVLLAAQANQSRRLLLDATPAEAAVLDAFHYTPVEVLMHRDTGLMPAFRADWSPVNLRVSPDHDQPESTIWVNAVQPALRQAPALFQTVQPQREPREELVIGRAQFERPVVDGASQRALRELQALHAEPGRRVWLCGSYAQAGVPLLESAVRSAHDVAQALGVPGLPGLRAEKSA